MRLEILTGGQKQQHDVNARKASLGGGEDDTVRIPGAPPKLIELRIEGATVHVRTRSQARMDNVPFPALVPRIWMPGETLSVGTVSVLFVPEEGVAIPGTAAVAKELLGGNEVPAAPSLPVFICLTGIESGRRYPITDRAGILGRAEDAVVRLRDASVSRRHAKVEEVDGRYWLEDLDSPNGVFVNGRRVSRRALLPDGAVIELGQTLLRFQVPQGSAPRIPTPVMLPKAPGARPPPPPIDPQPELPAAAESAPKLKLAPPPSEPVVESNEPAPSASQVQRIRISEIAKRLPKPQLPQLSSLEWAAVSGGAGMAIVGALVAWALLG